MSQMQFQACLFIFFLFYEIFTTYLATWIISEGWLNIGLHKVVSPGLLRDRPHSPDYQYQLQSPTPLTIGRHL